MERARSFRYAGEGIRAFFSRQHNAYIHLLATVIVFAAAFFMRLSATEFLVLILSTGFVWVAEIFNTVVEAIMDHLSPEIHHRVKYIKDLSAAAVLLAAFTAILAGLIIFLPKFL